MKKLLLFVGLLCWVPVLQAQEGTLIFIHPGRETVVRFPSSYLENTYTVSFLLPEDFVPLKRKYPVIVALGVVPKDDAKAINAYQKEHAAIVVGINFTEEDYAQRSAQIVQFLSQELFPYTDSNYLTKTGPGNRILAVSGENATKIALQVAQNPNLFGALALLHPGRALESTPIPHARILVVGSQEELADAQQILTQNGKKYGPDFAMRYEEKVPFWIESVNTDYLWAPPEKVQLKSLKADVLFNQVSLSALQDIPLRVWAILADNTLFHYVPHALRVSPLYMGWNNRRGVLQVISGAEPGKVRVYQTVDNLPFSVKIRLKK